MKYTHNYMKIFLDTADTEIINEYFKTGLVDGVTTNPTLIMKSGRNPEDISFFFVFLILFWFLFLFWVNCIVNANVFSKSLVMYFLLKSLAHERVLQSANLSPIRT